jgi:penicillin G amidase
MRNIKFIICLVVTVGLIYLLENRWVINGNPVPPLGRFLDPFSGFWRNIQPVEARLPGVLNLRGLQENVSISFDSMAIPHIFAKNNMDLYFAQGFITARHRLWQMEFQTHAAAGRVSEITGAGKNDVFLDYDRGQRRLGMVFGAKRALESLAENQEALISVEKYTEGINAYIASLSYKTLPFEYKLLDYRPEPWTVLKCALLLKSMAQTLNLDDKDIEMSNTLKLFGPEVVELLYPDREPIGDPIVDNKDGWTFNNTIPDSIPMALPDDLVKINRLPGRDPTAGSNNWAVSGNKTATGSPILCGDPHLTLSLPSLWYVAQLNAPGINTLGASLPGVPGVIIGCTDSIAWSVTNAQRDVVDWYKISFQDKTHRMYLLDSSWAQTEKIVETFKVRDKSVFYDTVMYTYWGPIPYDNSYRAANNLKHYALRWISHDTSEEFVAYYKLNRANNHAAFQSALDYFSAPAQNFVFASMSGDIAMRIQGKYPIRRPLEGKFLLDGSKRSNGWQQFIPNDQNIMVTNPARGFVSSANQYPVDATYPYYITASNFEAYRNRRINSVLSASDQIVPADMMKLQNDNYNLKAEESLPFFLSALDTTKFSTAEKEAYHVLSKWDYFNNKNSEGASYYEAWWDNLMPMLWDEMRQENVTLTMPTTFTTIRLLKEQPTLGFFDIQQTPEKETAADVIRKAFTFGVEDIESWKEEHASVVVEWGDFKDSYIGHLMRLDPLGVHVKAGGNHDIVNAHGRTKGPSWRMIVSLENTGIKMWGIYPGGQSGNPGSVFYSNMIDRWVNGQYFPMLFMHYAEDGRNRVFYSTQLNKQE